MALYFCGVANVDPQNPQWPERDRIVLSKGHAAPALYAVLANKGYFPRKDLTTLRKFGSYLQGHPDMNKVPGVDASTGSLGQGMSFSVGYALAGKRPGRAKCPDSGPFSGPRLFPGGPPRLVFRPEPATACDGFSLPVYAYARAAGAGGRDFRAAKRRSIFSPRAAPPRPFRALIGSARFSAPAYQKLR